MSKTKFHESWTSSDCIKSLSDFINDLDEGYCTQKKYRETTGVADATWQRHFGTFSEFRAAAKVKLTKGQGKFLRDIAKHASSDCYRDLIDRKDWGEDYSRENKSRFKTILFCSDLHDVEIDPFYLRVLLDTAKRVQPDVISIVGDAFDLYEFGKYTQDPREFDPLKRIKFMHDDVFGPMRKNCPNAQIDLIEGNHEARLLRLIANDAPALRIILSDLHGMTIPDLLGLKQFEMNYVAQCDLHAFTKSDLDKELRKNYRIYYETVLAHHYPGARHMGMPGVNGHHHKHEIHQNYSPVFGVYEWHQLGCGHRRAAVYCDASKWGNGFALCNIDTHTKTTSFDYIPIVDFAVSGGKWYHREKSEIIV